MSQRWWLRTSKSRMTLHRNERCAKQNLSAAWPLPKPYDDWDDESAVMYIVCRTCARTDHERLRLLADRLFPSNKETTT